MDLLSTEDINTSQRQRNYFRLANLIVDLGTDVIRKVILDNLKQSETLESLLANGRIRKQLEQLYENKMIVERQWTVLYPLGGGGSVDLMQIDITLWLILLHILILKNRPRVNWRSHAPQKRFDWVNDVYDIRDIRNELFHLPRPELDDETFKDLWRKATRAISNLDSEIISFDSYKNVEIDSNKLSVLQRHITEQFLQENNSHLHHVNSYLRFLMKCLVVLFISILVVLTIVYFSLRDQSCWRSRYSNSTGLGSVIFIPRQGWGADQPNEAIPRLNKHAKYVIYSHTASTATCETTDACCSLVKNIQKAEMNSGRWSDIAYHYIIDSNGVIYVGRSIDNSNGVLNDTTITENSISIALIGNFMYESNIPGKTVGALVVLISYLKVNFLRTIT